MVITDCLKWIGQVVRCGYHVVTTWRTFVVNTKQEWEASNLQLNLSVVTQLSDS
jgi:hypothetical protein